MKNKIFLLLFILFTFVELKSESVQDMKNIEKTFNKIITDLDSIINNSKTQNELVKSHFKFVLNKISNGQLPVVYDSTLTNEFYGCCGLSVFKDPEKNVSLVFGNFIVDKYQKYPTLIYAIIISVLQNAYDYYNNTSLFLISEKNKIERTYFEIDAMTIEALFLQNYVTNKSTLGSLERYLIRDLDQGLNGSAILFSKVDLPLLHKMDDGCI